MAKGTKRDYYAIFAGGQINRVYKGRIVGREGLPNKLGLPETPIEPSKDIDWLKQKAKQEDGCIVSVGGLVLDMEKLANGLVSILLNTIDRYYMTVKCIGPALERAGFAYELLVCDNGSSDRRVIDYIETLKPVYFRQNQFNEGCGQMHNQMLLRAKGDWICLLDNDIEIYGDGWLRALVETYESVPNSGVIGIHTKKLCPEKHNAVNVNGVTIFEAIPPKEDAVFGTRLFGRNVLEKVGYFSEDYGPYALVDNEYNSRVHHSGFRNYYIDWPSGLHLDIDVGQNTPYRLMKDASMKRAMPIMAENMRRYFETKNFHIPPPAMR